ncbi:Serine--tRNA ligase [Dissostichus eleginoides]|uniref:Serine--tRNA ligase n=1 Tax=Dissostichus eleginoides TaxID=100907 RepID=A0AAD9BKH9_DISEL|nr:Serine--tRNA ligase [Dissostichus eleginoides]
MFIQNARRQHDFFRRSPPYRGEPPTVAGFLLYPDTPAKMETTSREAFRSRTISQQDRGKGDNSASNTQQEANPALPQPDNIGINPAFRIDFSTVQREDYPGWPIMNPRRTGRSRQDNQT